MQHVFETMGTVVSLRFDEGSVARSILDDVEHVFRTADTTFSLYNPASELSRIARGELTLTHSSEAVRDAYERAVHWRNATGGAFTAHRPDGVIDLSGIVKALAIEAAGEILDAAGSAGWLLNAGGDVLARVGDTESGKNAWRVGIVDPLDRTVLLCSFELDETRAALATSGTAERGEHVWRTDARQSFSQVSVLAPDIVTADVLATAILSGGQQTSDLATEQFGVEVLTVDANGELLITPWLRNAVSTEPH
ncbi:FAD:protein FMN transferase [Subtercola frigoramans]|uniref:FAD:protein FMN transferase n=1 Tax=Subtercola frigoramans TaxID=120298 RepID=A0ABS2L1F0_9MICO|nr:FAD:protein FMN transferase [Subtercola frigoramans]MBM7470910.1 thiamine biosynthesis lipoprotein [Subtercola frigoramans]